MMADAVAADDPDRFRKPAPVIELTPEVIEELERLLDGVQKIASVTGLPWRSEPSGGKPVLCANKATKGCTIAYGTIGSWNEIDLAVAAVNALPALLTALRSSTSQEPDDDAFLRELDLVAPNIRASHNNTVFTRDEIMLAFKRYAATRLQAKAT